jgi:large subunit ribosomal protein L4
MTSTAISSGVASAPLTVEVRTADGSTAGTVELPPAVFDAQVNVPLIHQVVVAQLAAARQGTHDTKTRGEVRGGGKKPYRQKGTGRARQGSTRAPQFVGGGVVHGPTPRSYAQRTPKKMKQAALRGALSDRARGGRVHVIAGVVGGEAPSTKGAVSLLSGVTSGRLALVVADRADQLTWKSLRNAAGVHLIDPGQLNTYDVLCADDIVFTEGALAAFLAGPVAGGKGHTQAPGASDVQAGEPTVEDLGDAVDTLATTPDPAPATTDATEEDQ